MKKEDEIIIKNLHLRIFNIEKKRKLFFKDLKILFCNMCFALTLFLMMFLVEETLSTNILLAGFIACTLSILYTMVVMITRM